MILFLILLVVCVHSYAGQHDFDSPFGVQNSYVSRGLLYNSFSDLTGYINYINQINADLGIKWDRSMGLVIWWQKIQKSQSDIDKGKFDFNTVDTYIKNIGVNIVANVGSEKFDRSNFRRRPRNMDEYNRYLKAVVTRYSCATSKFNKCVNYWQIGNEPNIRGSAFWKDTPRNYAILLYESYKTIKEVCPKCKVLIGGSAVLRGNWDVQGFYPKVLKNLGRKRAFDIFDFHIMGVEYRKVSKMKIGAHGLKYLDIGTVHREAVQYFTKNGYPDIECWILEMSNYSGSPTQGNFPIKWPMQSEHEQAQELIKRYVYSIAVGVKKIFWSQLLAEFGYGRGSGYFDKVGVMYDGAMSKKDIVAGKKKLAYHTYKLMTQKLEGSDWSNVKDYVKLHNINIKDVYIFEFPKGNKSVLVAWSDAVLKKSIKIPYSKTKFVKVTEGIPTGKITFYEKKLSVLKNVISLELGATPVFIEEGEGTTVEISSLNTQRKVRRRW